MEKICVLLQNLIIISKTPAAQGVQLLFSPAPFSPFLSFSSYFLMFVGKHARKILFLKQN